MVLRPSAAKYLSAFLFCCLASSALQAAKHKKPGPARAAKPSHAPLAIQIDAILQDPAVAGSEWGISIVALDGTPLYALHDDVRFAAASNTKLLTTAAAIALLGPQFTTTTRVVAPNGIESGTVRGDLILVGEGDTSMSARALPYSQRTERTGDPLAAFDDLAAQVARAGVREITGNIVGDDTHFANQPWPIGWAWNDLQWEYGAPVSALVANDNVVYLTISPGTAPGEAALYQWLPQLDHFTIQSSIRTVASGPGIKASLGVSREPNSRVVHLWGTIPVNAQPSSMALAADDGAVLAAEALRERLMAHGVTVAGEAIARHRDLHDIEHDVGEADYPTTGGGDAAMGTTPLAPASQSTNAAAAVGTVLATRVSPPLLQDLTVTNKVSQNLHAEIALLQLDPVSRHDALVRERRWLQAAGLQPRDFLLTDGSGLSRDDMVTPRAFTTLLRYASTQPWGPAYRATLPVGGVDGTLNSRFLTAPLKANVQAKTGSLGEDASLTGFLTAASGRTVVFSILCNRHLPGNAVRADIDRIVAAIVAVD